MSPTLLKLVLLASTLRSTTYGYGEWNCGDVGHARPCAKGAVTSSGLAFDPDLPIVAVPAPSRLRFKPTVIYIRLKESNKCVPAILADKKNSRYVGKRYGGFDLSPGALRSLGVSPHGKWTGRVVMCPD